MIKIKKREWTISIDNEKYKIEFLPNLIFKLKYKILINSEAVENVECILNREGANYNFEIRGHNVTVAFTTKCSDYDLIIDGKSITTNKIITFYYRD
ncbi:MAG: hypothetical protein ACOYWZ_01450 [Bacillota bacterium]